MSFLAFLRLAGGGIVTWLSHRSFWQLVCLALACLAVVQHFTIADARHDRDSYRAQRDYYKQQLDAISSKRDEQKVVTRDNIKVVERTIHDADGKAKEVETQPLPEQCHGVTPSGVRNADV
jgi:hypothetical protein